MLRSQVRSSMHPPIMPMTSKYKSTTVPLFAAFKEWTACLCGYVSDFEAGNPRSPWEQIIFQKCWLTSIANRIKEKRRMVMVWPWATRHAKNDPRSELFSFKEDPFWQGRRFLFYQSYLPCRCIHFPFFWGWGDMVIVWYKIFNAFSNANLILFSLLSTTSVRKNKHPWNK